MNIKTLCCFVFCLVVRTEGVEICIDIGHGGTDPGNVTAIAGFTESDVNLLVGDQSPDGAVDICC